MSLKWMGRYKNKVIYDLSLSPFIIVCHGLMCILIRALYEEDLYNNMEPKMHRSNDKI